MSRTVTVCICTFRRPELLRRTLAALAGHKLDPGVRLDVVVADNDRWETARAVAEEFGREGPLEVTYCVEPEQNIALARNKALGQAGGELVAFLDDDEFPGEEWLTRMLEALERYGADGVLGPVRPHFDAAPPEWLRRSGLCDRPEHATGETLAFRQTRTGNVVFRRDVLEGLDPAFRPEFGNGGEDQDFFRRAMAQGRRFVWCNEAVVWEVVPPERQQRRYYWKRALQRGQNEKLLLTPASIARSLVAVPAYCLLLPVEWLGGEHRFMRRSIRLLDHLGKLLAAVGIQPLRGKYLEVSRGSS